MKALKRLNTIQSHYTGTRKAARATAKHLKAKGFYATVARNKTKLGWLISVSSTSRKDNETLLSLAGKAVKVLYR